MAGDSLPAETVGAACACRHNLGDGEKTPPVATPQGWFIAELYGVRRVPAPEVRALPPNINVDAPLSSHFTALMRAVDRNRPSVVAAPA